MEGGGNDNGSQFSINSANAAEVVHSSSSDSGINSSGSHSNQSNVPIQSEDLFIGELIEQVPANASAETVLEMSPHVIQSMSPTENSYHPPQGSRIFSSSITAQLSKRNQVFDSNVKLVGQRYKHETEYRIQRKLRFMLQSKCNGCSPCVSQRKFYTAQFALSGYKICPDTSFMQFAVVTVYPFCCTYRCINLFVVTG